MRGRIKIFLVIIYILIYSQKSVCQGVDSISFRLNPRLSFYSTEKEGEMLLHVPPLLQHSFLNLRIKVNDREISYWKGIPDRNLIRIPVRLELPEATYSVAAEIFTSGRTRYIAKCPLTILKPKLNEVNKSTSF